MSGDYPLPSKNCPLKAETSPRCPAAVDASEVHGRLTPGDELDDLLWVNRERARSLDIVDVTGRILAECFGQAQAGASLLLSYRNDVLMARYC